MYSLSVGCSSKRRGWACHIIEIKYQGTRPLQRPNHGWESLSYSVSLKKGMQVSNGLEQYRIE
jgi:hypothetical protein